MVSSKALELTKYCGVQQEAPEGDADPVTDSLFHHHHLAPLFLADFGQVSASGALAQEAPPLPAVQLPYTEC